MKTIQHSDVIKLTAIEVSKLKNQKVRLHIGMNKTDMEVDLASCKIIEGVLTNYELSGDSNPEHGKRLPVTISIMETGKEEISNIYPYSIKQLEVLD